MKLSITTLKAFNKRSLQLFAISGAVLLNACVGVSPFFAEKASAAKTTITHSRTAPVIQRVSGSNAVATAVAVSKKYFAPNTPVAYIVNTTAYADGIVAASMKTSGPILYSDAATLPASVATELQRLQPKKVIVVGGASLVSDTVMNTIKTKIPSSSPVQRLSGANRYTTAVSVSQSDYPTGATTAYISNGTAYPDAIVGTQQLANGPLLYVALDNAPAATINELIRLKVKKVVIIGSASVVSQAVANSITQQTGATIERFGGANRYDTAVSISKKLFPNGSTEVFIAHGDSFGDSQLIGALPVTAPLLYVSSTVPDSVMTEIQRLGASKATIVGGSARVSDATMQKVQKIMRGTQVLKRVSTGVSYYALAHPDDELASWAITDASEYTVFILSTQGENSGYCTSNGGKGSVQCRNKRLNSWHQFLNNYYTVTDYGNQPGGYRLYKGPNSARLIFDYGDGNLTPAEVAQAINAARQIDYGISTENYISGGNYWDPERNPECPAEKSDYVCGLYDHTDHHAVYQAISAYPFPNKVTFHGSYNPTVNAGANMGKPLFETMIACPNGTYNQAYSWLHPQCWTRANARVDHWNWMKEY